MPAPSRAVRSAVAVLVLLTITLLLTGCGQSPVWNPAATSLSDRTEIPIELPGRGMPGLVLNERGDSGEASLAVIDTGSPVTIVTKRFAARSGLKTRATSLAFKDFQGKETTALRVARLPALKLGDATFAEFDVLVADLPAMTALSDRLDAVLSRSLFQDVLLTIDYPRRRLILETGSLPEPNGKDVLRLRRDPSGHLLIPAKLLGEDAWLVLDTGHTADGLTLSRYRLIAMPWASTPVEGYRIQTFLGLALARIGRMNGDVTIGQYTLRRPIIGISLDDDLDIVGASVLRHFVVTIDQKNDRIRLARPSMEPIQSPPVRRLGFTFIDTTDADGAIIEPLPGSDAERAGLERGDRILSINGVPPQRWSSAFLEQLEEAGQALSMRIDRAGREIDLLIPLTTLVP